MKRNHIYGFIRILTAISLTLYSCTDFLEVPAPATQIGSNTVFEDESTANSAIIGIYSAMTNSSGFASGGLSSVTLLAGRSADDFFNYSQGAAAEFAANELTQNNSYVNEYIWKEGYSYIYDANAIIEGVAKSTHLSQTVKDQLHGEAKFLRGFCYFYLVNFFQHVPLITGTDYRVNSVAVRSSPDIVYAQIVEDLLAAKDLLKANYAVAEGQKTRANQLAAMALLARVYLYQAEWEKAEAESTLLIESGLALESDINNVFLKNSTEAIWQLIPPKGAFATNEGSIFILTDIPSEVSLSKELMDSFEANDVRKSQWTSSVNVAGTNFNFPFKYKVKYGDEDLAEYSMILRLAEQYLIRAEARAHQTKIHQAIGDLDVLRKRAGLPLIAETNATISQSDLLGAIERERRVELFAEWGHRWLDLKRTHRADEVLANKPESSWQASDALYPVPLTEIQNNPNLLPQNPGY